MAKYAYLLYDWHSERLFLKVMNVLPGLSEPNFVMQFNLQNIVKYALYNIY